MISPDQFGYIPGVWVGVVGRTHVLGLALLDLAVLVDPCIYEHDQPNRYRTVKIMLPWNIQAPQREAPPNYYVARDILGDILYHAGQSGPQVRAFYRFMARCRDGAELAVELETRLKDRHAKIIPLAPPAGYEHRMYASLVHPATRSLPRLSVLLH